MPPSGSAPRVVGHGSRGVWLAPAAGGDEGSQWRDRAGFAPASSLHCREWPERYPAGRSHGGHSGRYRIETSRPGVPLCPSRILTSDDREQERKEARALDEDFTQFVLRHDAALMRTAWLLTGDRGLGEDLVQSALARAYGQWSKVQRADDPAAYVHKIMINLHLSWRRRLASTERVVEFVPDRPTDDHQDAHAERDRMRLALSRLSLRVRTAVVLRYFEDLSEAETARRMSCSVSTVNNHVTKGLATLRGLLAELPPATPDHQDLSPTTRRRS